jgi:nucleoside-diphosphate-sugar epimerase
MRVLVTGGAGFFGREVGAVLRDDGHEVIAAGHDTEHPVELRLAEQVAELFAEVRPDAVVHLAGTARREDFARGPEAARTENVVHPLLNVLDAAGARRVVYVSSAAACGEGPFGDTVALRPRDLYGAARASAEALGARRAAGTFCVLRPFLLLGEGARPFSPFAPRSAFLRPDTAIDVIHVHDAARAAVMLLQQGTSGAAYTVSTETTLPLEALLATGRVPGVELRPAEGAPLRWSAPSTRLNALGWRPILPAGSP